MEQHELRPPRGSKQDRKRLGRGNASGQGTYAGRGLKGQKARSGGGVRPAFEGGQTPLIRRLPHRRGFHNPFRVEYTPVNLSELSRLPAGQDVTPETLREAGIVRSLAKPIKILADGEVEAALTVRTHRVSAGARAKIEAAGGTVEELTPRKGPDDKRKRKTTRKAKPVAAASADEAEKDDGEAAGGGGKPEETETEEADDGAETGETADAE